MKMLMIDGVVLPVVIVGPFDPADLQNEAEIVECDEPPRPPVIAADNPEK